MHTDEGVSRRAFGKMVGLGAAMAALPPLAVAAPPAVAAVPSGPVRLSANENPYGPSPAAIRAMTAALSVVPRYPDQLLDSLPGEIAATHGLSASNILLGNGSSEILKLAQLAFVPRSLTMADPSFEAIAMYAAASGRDVVKVPLRHDWSHDLERMKGADLVYICNPNNPTGTITPKADLRAFIEKAHPSTIVLVDEAYHHYAENADYESVIPLVRDHPNLIVARTFSKIYALAGLRCGYAAANEKIIAAMGAEQQWDAMNVMALVAASASLRDTEHVVAGRLKNRETRSWVVSELERSGFATLPTETNFMMVDLARPAKPILSAMREHGVEVGRLFPALPSFMRVTIGTRSEMERFLEVFRAVTRA